MIAFFIFGAFLGGVLGYTFAALMAMTSRDEEKRNVRDSDDE